MVVNYRPGIAAPTAQATAFTWSGTTSNAWNLNANWGGSGFPNAYTDTATIGTVITNTPVSLSTTALLGVASGSALTLSNVAGSATGLDITSTGTLGMQGGITLSSSTTNGRKITIEGILRNDAASSATTYTIGGGTNAGDIIQLVNGTISSQNGGVWAFARPVQGYGIISSPFTNSSTISANVSGQTLHITGSEHRRWHHAAARVALPCLWNLPLPICLLLSSAGAVNLNGATITGMTLNSPTQTINLTGDSTLKGTITENQYTTFALNGHTLNLNGLGNYGNGLSSTQHSFNVGTGTLNNSGTTFTTLTGTMPVTLTGGNITNTGGSLFTIVPAISGYGLISGVSLGGGGSATASGGNLTFDGGTGVTLGSSSGSGANLISSAGNTLDLKGKLTYINPGFINPGGGTINFDGVTIAAGTWSPTLSAGAINVTNNSFLTSTTGTFNSAATLAINSGNTLDASAANFTNTGTVNVQAGAIANWGNFTNNGAYKSDPSTNNFVTLTVGSTGYLQAANQDAYIISGNFINNSTQGALWNTKKRDISLYRVFPQRCYCRGGSGRHGIQQQLRLGQHEPNRPESYSV